MNRLLLDLGFLSTSTARASLCDDHSLGLRDLDASAGGDLNSVGAMVNFGRRLATQLMHPGWESKYVDYAALNKMIDDMKAAKAAGQDVTAVSAQFLSEIKTHIERVNEFVLEQTASEESEFQASHRKPHVHALSRVVACQAACAMSHGCRNVAEFRAPHAMASRCRARQVVQGIDEPANRLGGLRQLAKRLTYARIRRPQAPPPCAVPCRRARCCIVRGRGCGCTMPGTTGLCAISSEPMSSP